MGNFHDFGFGNYFLDMIPNAQTTKIKTDKMEFIEIKKSLLYIKKRYKKVQRRSIKWENIFENHIYDQGLIWTIQRASIAK